MWLNCLCFSLVSHAVLNCWKVKNFSSVELWAYNFSFFLSYQDPIQLDIAEVETALFNVKIASHLAASQILTRWNHFLSGFWRFDFNFCFLFFNNNMDTGLLLLAV